MGLDVEPGAGTIYRYHRGETEPLFHEISIPNAITFAPDSRTAYFADTAEQKIFVQTLDAEGWPEGPAQTFVALTHQLKYPDGAVVDSQGNLWVALWGSSEVVCFSPSGQLQTTLATPAIQPTCPAFGGEENQSLFVTSQEVAGQAEHSVIIW